MSSFMMKRKDYRDDVSVGGRKNLDKLLTSLSNVLYIVEYPHNSIYEFQYEHDIANGAQPDPTTFIAIFEKYFNMSISCFFNSQEIDDGVFNEFENACYNQTMSLCDIQVRHAYGHLLFVEYALL